MKPCRKAITAAIRIGQAKSVQAKRKAVHKWHSVVIEMLKGN